MSISPDLYNQGCTKVKYADERAWHRIRSQRRAQLVMLQKLANREGQK